MTGEPLPNAADAIVRRGHSPPVVESVETAFGVRYVVEGELTAPAEVLTMIHGLDRVALTKSLPDLGLEAGDIIGLKPPTPPVASFRSTRPASSDLPWMRQ